jgi:hypothetical protein
MFLFSQFVQGIAGAGAMIAWLVFIVTLLRAFGWMNGFSFARIYKSKSIAGLFKTSFSETLNMKVDYQSAEYKSRAKILKRSLGALLAMIFLFVLGVAVEMKSMHPRSIHVGEF